jgi:hypothetical protein
MYLSVGTIALATARFVGGWFAEDTGSLRDELMSALPTLLTWDDLYLQHTRFVVHIACACVFFGLFGDVPSC